MPKSELFRILAIRNRIKSPITAPMQYSSVNALKGMTTTEAQWLNKQGYWSSFDVIQRLGYTLCPSYNVMLSALSINH